MAALATATRAYVERLAPGGVPHQCRVGGRHYVVSEVHSHWVTGSPWWLTGQDVDTHVWRVTLVRSGVGARVADLRCTGTHWQITRVGGAR
jgi:hypothetical protein